MSVQVQVCRVQQDAAEWTKRQQRHHQAGFVELWGGASGILGPALGTAFMRRGCVEITILFMNSSPFNLFSIRGSCGDQCHGHIHPESVYRKLQANDGHTVLSLLCEARRDV